MKIRVSLLWMVIVLINLLLFLFILLPDLTAPLFIAALDLTDTPPPVRLFSCPLLCGVDIVEFQRFILLLMCSFRTASADSVGVEIVVVETGAARCSSR